MRPQLYYYSLNISRNLTKNQQNKSFCVGIYRNISHCIPATIFFSSHSIHDLMQLLSKLLNEILADNDGINIHWNHLNPLKSIEISSSSKKKQTPKCLTRYKYYLQRYFPLTLPLGIHWMISVFYYFPSCIHLFVCFEVDAAWRGFNLKSHFIQEVKR